MCNFVVILKAGGYNAPIQKVEVFFLNIFPKKKSIEKKKTMIKSFHKNKQKNKWKNEGGTYGISADSYKKNQRLYHPIQGLVRSIGVS